MNNPTTSDSQATYKAHQNDIARLMDVLQMELDRHAQDARTKTKCWGETGELAKVRSDLIELVSFISQMDRPSIENFLTEAQ